MVQSTKLLLVAGGCTTHHHRACRRGPHSEPATASRMLSSPALQAESITPMIVMIIEYDVNSRASSSSRVFSFSEGHVLFGPGVGALFLFSCHCLATLPKALRKFSQIPCPETELPGACKHMVIFTKIVVMVLKLCYGICEAFFLGRWAFLNNFLYVEIEK